MTKKKQPNKKQQPVSKSSTPVKQAKPAAKQQPVSKSSTPVKQAKPAAKQQPVSKANAPVKQEEPTERKIYDYDPLNVSATIKPGQIIQTDEKNVFLVKGTKNAQAQQQVYSKTGTASRPQVVIDTNNRNELATVNLTTHKGIPLPSNPKSKFKPYVEIYDDERKPITIGNKFFKNRNKKIPLSDVIYIRDECINHPEKAIRDENKKRLRKLKKNPNDK